MLKCTKLIKFATSMYQYIYKIKIDYQVVIVVAVITACVGGSPCPQAWKKSHCPLGVVGNNSGEVRTVRSVRAFSASGYDNVVCTRNIDSASLTRK